MPNHGRNDASHSDTNAMNHLLNSSTRPSLNAKTMGCDDLHASSSGSSGGSSSTSSPFGMSIGAETVKLLQALLDANIDAACISNETGQIFAVNNAMLHLFGYKRWELIQENVSILMPDQMAKHHGAAMRRYVQTGIRHSLGEVVEGMSGRRKDGSMFTLTLKITENWDGQTRLFFAVIRDSSGGEELKQCHTLIDRMLPQDVKLRLLSNRNSSLLHLDNYAIRTFAATHECTIGFIDLVDFTRRTSSWTPRRVVQMLAEVFTEFDTACPAFDIEPVKTIGDCYMFVSQRTSRLTAHAANGVLFALRCVEITRMRRRTQKDFAFDVRIGIATGLVTSGVVTSGRLAFDTWGPTVNLASRLEHHAPVNGVLVSQETYEHASNCKTLNFEGPLNNVQAKGLGEVKAYLAWDSREQSHPSCCSTRKQRCLIIDSPDVIDTSIITTQHYLSTAGVESLKTTYEEDIDPALWDVILICVRQPSNLGVDTCKKIADHEHASSTTLALLIPEGFFSEELCNQYIRQRVGNEECFPLPVCNDSLLMWIQEILHEKEREGDVEKETPPSPQLTNGVDASSKQEEDSLVPLSPTIIVADVDGNEELIDLLNQTYDIHILTLTGRDEVMDLLKRSPNKISLILLDVSRPESDGIETVRLIRASYSDQVLPIIGLTDSIDVNILQQCTESGMNDVIHIPIEFIRLNHLLMEWVPNLKKCKKI